MKTEEHIKVLALEADLFASSARQADLETGVEHCPGWNVRDLVRHLSEIHLWAAARVARRTSKLFPDDISEHTESWPELAVFWPEDEDLIDWYLKTNANLVSALESASHDDEMPTFLPAPSPLAMWARRQAHETAVHRFDAEHAAGNETLFDGTFAADGLDELLSGFAPRSPGFPTDRPRTMAVRTTDTGDRWHLTMTAEDTTTTRGDDAADVTISGRASDLYLLLWNRLEDSVAVVEGDASLLQTWHESRRVRWFT